MNKFQIILLCLAFVGVSEKALSQVIVNVSNINNIEGHIHIGLYNDADVFLIEGEEFIIIRTKVTSNEINIPIDSLEAGSYAVSLFHDVNSNNQIEKNFFGIPKEPYGFSKNFKPLFRAPKFSECSFDYNGEEQVIEIILLD